MEVLHILIRVSTQVQEDGTSLKTQEEQGVELSKRLKMNNQIHNEGGTSSNKDTLDNRPVMLNLLKLMDEGKVKHLYVYNTDRISRNQSTWYLIRQKMVKNKVVLYTSNGKYDTSGSMEGLILGILSEVSQYDNKIRTERSRTGKMEKVKNNFFRGGDPPFGYRIQKVQGGSKLIPDDYESNYVRLVYDMYHSGHTIKKIKERLESEGVKTRRGFDHWSLGSLQLMLRNDSYIGIDEFHDKKTQTTIRNEIPSIISHKLFEEVQNRRKGILRRKGQLNRTTHPYLIRDLMYCSCGTPIGGRFKPIHSIQHYYCPLSERVFNKSISSDESCDMKRCVNIHPTKELVWNTLKELLINTEKLHESLDSVIKETPELSVFIRKQRGKLTRKIEELEKELNTVTNGIVEIEKKRILRQFHTEDIYHQIKKKLDTEYKRIHLSIEENKNLLSFHYQKDKWYKSISEISKLFTSNKSFTFQQKKVILTHFIQSITLSYHNDKKVHELHLFLKIPLIFEGVKRTISKNVHKKILRKPSKTLTDQPNTRSFYSTVTLFAKFLG